MLFFCLLKILLIKNIIMKKYHNPYVHFPKERLLVLVRIMAKSKDFNHRKYAKNILNNIILDFDFLNAAIIDNNEQIYSEVLHELFRHISLNPKIITGEICKITHWRYKNELPYENIRVNWHILIREYEKVPTRKRRQLAVEIISMLASLYYIEALQKNVRKALRTLSRIKDEKTTFYSPDKSDYVLIKEYCLETIAKIKTKEPSTT